jgi:hypothetical protein
MSVSFPLSVSHIDLIFGLVRNEETRPASVFVLGKSVSPVRFILPEGSNLCLVRWSDVHLKDVLARLFEHGIDVPGMESPQD